MKKSTKAFTLIELITGCAIVCIVVALVLGLIGAINGNSGQKPVATASYNDLPMHFSVQERSMTLVTTLDVLAGGVNYGVVTRDIGEWATTFNYNDSTGVVAIGTMRLDKFRTTIEVTDRSGRLIGTIRDDSSFTAWNVYSVLNGSGNPIAESKKVQFGSTSFTLTSPSGEVIATLERQVAFGPDCWTVVFSRGTAPDQRVLVMLAAFKTFADNKSDD